MARATTKADLTSSANEQFNKMWKLIDCMTKSQQEAAFAEEMATVGKETHWSRDKNLRDVLKGLPISYDFLLLSSLESSGSSAIRCNSRSTMSRTSVFTRS